ncbi:MAG TPA: MotA/TolQ/ExbB proton channel family protein [Opitutaceae bacterium]|nr:MotA/TolQ/ExbB proton channel family protein [Opitutaceae bacterium]
MLLAVVELTRVFREAGPLAYILLSLSGVAVFIICERAFALRTTAVLPPELSEAVLLNKQTSGGRYSVLGRVIEFAERHASDPDATKAYARLEVMKMERGVRYLDTIYTGAPLLGLIGTVWGLLSAFSSTRDQMTGLPDPAKFSQSVGYALSATLLGLIVALVALAGNGLIQRRIDHHAAQLDVLLERVIARVRPKAKEDDAVAP